MAYASDNDRYLTIAELIARWSIGRNKTCEIARAPRFLEALVLTRDRHRFVGDTGRTLYIPEQPNPCGPGLGAVTRCG